MDDGEAAQLPASFLQEPAVAMTGLATASFWDGYAEGSQKTHVQVRCSETFRAEEAVSSALGTFL